MSTVTTSTGEASTPVTTSGTGAVTPSNDAMPSGSLTNLPGGSTISGTSTVIPQAVLDSVGSTQVTNTKLYIAGALILLVVFMVVWFAYDKAGSVIDIVDNVTKKL